MKIVLDDLTGDKIIAFIQEHLDNMAVNSPPESIHALAVEELKRPEITFWSVWDGEDLIGCGALKQLDNKHGEIKSMRTADSHRRKGVAKYIVTHIIKEACNRGYHRLSLETGRITAFEPARRLYASFGFQYCRPFANYVEDPNSVFMTKEL
ncbi:GNAT family N-acetyltransferase [Ornithinibacillus xuwenensis]|uniref:GNAT family N-acetyltransferase n=1 Tax=Ornithinibacillus xuwenensis TaxID=3144668 RepID=A0ABU9XGU6_9BACI